MPKKKSYIRKLVSLAFRQMEAVFFLLKTVLNERHFIYLSAVVVAISCACAVIALKAFAHYVFQLATYVNAYLKLPFINSVLPIIGILLTVFVVRNFLGGQLEKGSSRILYAVAKRGGIMQRKQMYAQIITSSLTVGLGGSAGLESPITITGAAFGSNFAQRYKLSQKDRILLLACGVAAGIGAAFNAPIAGVLFAIEVVLTDVTITAFIPIIISAATGALVSNILLDEEVLLSFRDENIFDFHNIPFYIILGILAGFVSVYHARQFRKVEGFFGRLKNKSYKRALFGASILAVMIFFFPTLFGEGYESIKTLSTDNPQALLTNTLFENFRDSEIMLLIFVGITTLIKCFATGITLGSGGNGGNFAPSLFVGSYLGFFVAKAVNMTGLTHQLPVSNFTIVGMAGILSGLFHAPLTAIFLIGEITGGYGLMVPLMIVSSVSFAVSKQFETHSMDVKHLADKGHVFTSDKDRNILSNIDLLRLVQTDLHTIKREASIEEIIALLSETNQNIFAIVDARNNLVGVIDFEEIRAVIFKPYQLKFMKIDDLICRPKDIINTDDGMELIFEKFENANAGILPVISNGRYFGFLSKIALLEAYRSKYKEMVIE